MHPVCLNFSGPCGVALIGLGVEMALSPLLVGPEPGLEMRASDILEPVELKFGWAARRHL